MPPESPAAPPPVFVLRVGSRRTVLGPGITTIGRDRGNDVHLSDSSVSRFHARIIVEHSRATIEDLESRNGTVVQNEPVTGSRALQDGDEVEFGSVKVWFIVERPDDPTTLTPSGSE